MRLPRAASVSAQSVVPLFLCAEKASSPEAVLQLWSLACGMGDPPLWWPLQNFPGKGRTLADATPSPALPISMNAGGSEAQRPVGGPGGGGGANAAAAAAAAAALARYAAGTPTLASPACSLFMRCQFLRRCESSVSRCAQTGEKGISLLLYPSLLSFSLRRLSLCIFQKCKG